MLHQQHTSPPTLVSFNNPSTFVSTLNVSGNTLNTTLNNATTINSSLNVVGNIIASGTALTNLNYNAITNRPDLTVYATTVNLNSLSTYSNLNISNIDILIILIYKSNHDLILSKKQ